MKALTKRIICFIIAIASLTCLALSGCGKTEAHVCESKCPKCGYCLNKDCKDPACELKCPGHKEDKATIKSVEILNYPKTDYYPGDVFDISGLAVKATLSNGKTKKFYETDFAIWTHKDEQLTEDIKVIRVTVPDYEFTFDIAINVGFSDVAITANIYALKETYYTTEETIDFTLVKVRVTRSGITNTLKADEWKLLNGETEITEKANVAAKDLGVGDITLTAQYMPEVKTQFTITIVAADAVISPAVIEAEDCIYKFDDNGAETDEKYTLTQDYSTIQVVENGAAKDAGTLKFGSSGNGAVRDLKANYNKIYFKFKVNVPETGKYKLKARGISVGGKVWIGNFWKVNINGAKGSDGKFTFDTQWDSPLITTGNRIAEYSDDNILKKDWTNFFWWSYFDLFFRPYELKKGENEIRIYVDSGFPLLIDYFEIVKDGEAKASILSYRGNTVESLDSETLVIKKGEKLTDIIDTPTAHPVKYTLLYLRTTTGAEIPVLESMLEGKIDYNKVGEKQEVTVTDPVSGEQASFALFIEDPQENF